MPASYKVIVLGLGAMGSAAVYQLGKRGISVLGIDQFEPPHTLGSSHGETRITRQAIGEYPHYTLFSLRSYEIFREIEKQTKEELLCVTGGLMISSERRTGFAHVANFFPQTLESAKKHGIRHETLSAPEIRRRFPQFAVHDDEVAYYEYEAGFLRPENCVRAQLDLAKHHGAEIHTGERVLDIAEVAGGVTVRTTQATYTCEQLIVSAGSWLPQLFEGRCAEYFRVTRQLLCWFDIERCYEQFAPPRFPIFIWETQGADAMYGIPAIDGPQGGVKIASSAYMQDTSADTINRTVGDDETAILYERQVAPFFPLVGRKCIKSAVCLYTRTPTSEFIIDRLTKDGPIIICSPCSGHGFKHSAAVGEVVAQLATEGKSTIDVSALTFARMAASVF